MTTSMLAFGKVNASATVDMGPPLLRRGISRIHQAQYYHSSVKVKDARTAQQRHADDAADQRELFVDILSANATRRDAKQFLARFNQTTNQKQPQKQAPAKCPTVNLGNLYAPARAIADSPQFVRSEQTQQREDVTGAELHVALVSLRAPETLDDKVVDGLATTISQLVKLDMRIAIVLAPGSGMKVVQAKKVLTEQASRISRAVDLHSPAGSRVVPDSLAQETDDAMICVSLPRLVHDPLHRGIVTIVPTLCYDANVRLQVPSLRDVMKAMTESLHGGEKSNGGFSLDRIILLDSQGGLPSQDRGDGAHVFVNLVQERAAIDAELEGMLDGRNNATEAINIHRENLAIVHDSLSVLPPSSSALIVTPEEAAASSTKVQHGQHAIGAGTRKYRNTLIHNLLTNKPLVSSSLPFSRFASNTSTVEDTGALPVNRATLVKKGMPLTIIPGVQRNSTGWTAPESGRTSLDLENDPRVDLPRLQHLINDSFRRKLDVWAYLDRIAGRVAGLIIAGNYEGGAILTWEQSPDHRSGDPPRLVPYLDKFAVLQSSQGSAGVADVLFQAMVRTCLPNGVCWRSRQNNPANKWYFERAAGSWHVPDTNWTMFWTGEGVVDDRQKWDDYVSVCRNIVPTWLDDKPAD